MDRHRKSNDLLQTEFFPNLEPLYKYPGPPFSEDANKNWGSTEGIIRYLGIELLMLASLELKIQHFLDINRSLSQSIGQQLNQVNLGHFSRMEKELAALKEKSETLHTKNKFLERKIEELDLRMARSFAWRLKKYAKKSLLCSRLASNQAAIHHAQRRQWVSADHSIAVFLSSNKRHN